MDWARESASWPFSAHSRFVISKPHKWHLQEMGDGPLILLIHGAGGATHSWQHLIPYLIPQYRVVAIDLPGQGFTQLGARQRSGLDDTASDLLALCAVENLHPTAIIGHSAGAAIALRMAEMMEGAPPQIIGINAALEPFDGLAGVFFPIIAKTIAALPLAADFFSATTARGNGVARIIKGTGSTLPSEDLDFYRRLVASRDHVNATLRMMSQWELEGLLERLPQINAQTLFIVGDNDKAVPPTVSKNAAQKMANAACKTLPGLGHLAHEEDAEAIAALVLAALGP